MASLDILYLVLSVSIVILTVTLVWLANELIGLLKSLRSSAEDAAELTKEFKEKVLLISEALDRVGSAATTVIGMIEDTIEAIKEKRDKLADGFSLVAGASRYIKSMKGSDKDGVERDGAKEEPEESKSDRSETEKKSTKPAKDKEQKKPSKTNPQEDMPE